MTPLVRRLLVGLVPPALVCVATGVWVADQAALAVRLIQEHRRSAQEA